jgi:hypothetical protein
MALLGPQRVAVRRLRARDGRADAVAARLRTERALARVELRPRLLPPGAVLLVRSLRARVDEAPAALDELLRSASRPAREAVPAGALAVLFSSRAELLACLADDACRGIASGRWWWKLVASDTTPRGATATWLDAPETVPAAFAILATRARAAEFASRIDDAQADELAASVARVHGVALPWAHSREGFVATPARDPGHPPPGDDPAPEAHAAGLSAAQASLLSLGLTLARAPAGLRAVTVAEPVGAEPAGRSPQPQPQPQPDAPGREPRGRGQPDAPLAARPQPPAREPAAPDRPTGGGRASRPWSPAPPPLDDEERRPLEAPQPAPATIRPTPPGDIAERARRTESGVDAPPSAAGGEHANDSPGPLPFSAGEVRETVPLAWRPPVATAIGGLLFLIGVAQRLGLYADFTEPASPGLVLDPWRFVALVGSALVDPDEHVEDPIWVLLEELTRGENETQSPDELDGHTKAVREWLETHVDLPLAEVLERPASLYADETRVDAVFALVGHPIELRLSGIDIDPGWIPAAGRGLYFHFE